jgi:hypothetical protein
MSIKKEKLFHMVQFRHIDCSLANNKDLFKLETFEKNKFLTGGNYSDYCLTSTRRQTDRFKNVLFIS